MLQGWMQADVLMESKLRQQEMEELAKFWWSAIGCGEHNWHGKAALSATRTHHHARSH
jgi:endonuclease/exonuclease/phosphatase family metal-dependent hydrolase